MVNSHLHIARNIILVENKRLRSSQPRQAAERYMQLQNPAMKDNLELLLAKYDFQKKAFESKINTESIEDYFSGKLPEDYILFLEKYLAFEGFINVEFVKLWAAEELIETNKGYEIQKYLPNTIGIGSNGSGEIIIIEFNETESSQIVLTPISFESEYNINIGESFTEFLVRLDNGKAWFD